MAGEGNKKKDSKRKRDIVRKGEGKEGERNGKRCFKTLNINTRDERTEGLRKRVASLRTDNEAVPAKGGSEMEIRRRNERRQYIGEGRRRRVWKALGVGVKKEKERQKGKEEKRGKIQGVRRKELVRAKGGEPGKLTPFLAYPRSLFNCILLSNFPRGAIDRDTRRDGGSFASYLRRHWSPPSPFATPEVPLFSLKIGGK